MDYPYQPEFRRFLQQQHLAPLTIKTYDTSLSNLFNFLLANRPQFATHPDLKHLTETDVRAYLNYLQTDKRITMTTYNKILSQLLSLPLHPPINCHLPHPHASWARSNA